MPGWLEKSRLEPDLELDGADFVAADDDADGLGFAPRSDAVGEGVAAAGTDGVEGAMLSDTTGDRLKLEPYPESYTAEELAGESVVKGDREGV